MQYSLYRDGVEIFRSPTEKQFIDDNVIMPYETYTYFLKACTVEGCTDSGSVRLKYLHVFIIKLYFSTGYCAPYLMLMKLGWT